MRNLGENQIEKKISGLLFIVFFSLYFIINFKFIYYLSINYEELKQFSPFANYSYFLLNIFNFDPSIYNNDAISPIHPFIIFLTDFINGVYKIFNIDSILGKNLFLLIFQSIINALNIVFIFLTLRTLNINIVTSIIFSFLFGITSYSIVSSFVPDSYTYAQFIIIISLLFLFKKNVKSQVYKSATLGILNFGITSTNIIPFIFGLFVNYINQNNIKLAIKKIIKYILILFFVCMIVTIVQYLAYGQTWFFNILNKLDSGGFSYTENFSLSKHWYSFYLLFVNPIIMPSVELIDLNLMAFVSSWGLKTNIVFKVLPILISILIFWGCIINIKKRELWILLGYILSAVFLHIVIGFGLAAIEYDMFLYAGHYLPVIILMLGIFTTNFKKNSIKYINIFLIIVSLLILSNNLIKHNEFYNYMVENFDNLKSNYKILDSKLEWEFFSDREGYKIVRVNLELAEKPYILFKGETRLNDCNADLISTSDLSDIYGNGYLYISISNYDSNWRENYIPSVEEIKKYFNQNEYKFYY